MLNFAAAATTLTAPHISLINDKNLIKVTSIGISCPENSMKQAGKELNQYPAIVYVYLNLLPNNLR